MKTYIELEVEVDYQYSPPSVGLKGSYGEPLEPDEPESVEIHSVRCNGEEIIYILTNKQMDDIEADIWADIQDY